MPDQRPFRDRWLASFKTGLTVFCLAVGLGGLSPGPACALDAGDGTVIAPQPGRRSLHFDSGKVVRLDDVHQRHFGGKRALSAYQVHAMNFGSLRRGDGSVVLSPDDVIVSDPELLIFGGTPYSAVFRIEGDSQLAVSIDVSMLPVAGFQLSGFESNLGPLPLFGQPLDGAGELVFMLGAQLTLTAAELVVGDDQPISYTITATYE